MKQDWFKGYAPDEIEARRAEVKSHSTAFKDLAKVLEGLELSEAVTDYNDGWQHKQAHRNGELIMLKRINGLLDLKD